MTNIVNESTINAASAYFKADLTLIAKRTLLGQAFIADGFQVATDFAAATAKDAGREDRFRAIQYLAQESLPAAVKIALRDTDVSGKKVIKADGVSLTKTEWSKRVPAKVRDLKNAFTLFLKAGADPEKKGAKANAPRDINTRINEEVNKLIKAVGLDKDAEAPLAKFDHAEMIAAFVRINGLLGKK
jgi:hypothetical protein